MECLFGGGLVWGGKEGWKGKDRKVVVTVNYGRIYMVLIFNSNLVLLKVVFFNHYSSVSLLIGDLGEEEVKISCTQLSTRRHKTEMENPKIEPCTLGCFFFFVLAPRASLSPLSRSIKPSLGLHPGAFSFPRATPNTPTTLPLQAHCFKVSTLILLSHLVWRGRSFSWATLWIVHTFDEDKVLCSSSDELENWKVIISPIS